MQRKTSSASLALPFSVGLVMYLNLPPLQGDLQPAWQSSANHRCWPGTGAAASPLIVCKSEESHNLQVQKANNSPQSHPQLKRLIGRRALYRSMQQAAGAS